MNSTHESVNAVTAAIKTSMAKLSASLSQHPFSKPQGKFSYEHVIEVVLNAEDQNRKSTSQKVSSNKTITNTNMTNNQIQQKGEEELQENIRDHIQTLIGFMLPIQVRLETEKPKSMTQLTQEDRKEIVYLSFFSRTFNAVKAVKYLFACPEFLSVKEPSIGVLLRPLLLDALIISYLETIKNDAQNYSETLNGIASDAFQYHAKFLSCVFPNSNEDWANHDKALIQAIQYSFPVSDIFKYTLFSANTLYNKLSTDYQTDLLACLKLYNYFSKHDHFSIISELGVGGVHESDIDKLQRIKTALDCITGSLSMVCTNLHIKFTITVDKQSMAF